MRNNKPEQSITPRTTSPMFIFFCHIDADVFISRNAVRVATKNTISNIIGNQRANIHKETTEIVPSPANERVNKEANTTVKTSILYSILFKNFNIFIFISFFQTPKPDVDSIIKPRYLQEFVFLIA
jgi:hypothetical protein